MGQQASKSHAPLTFGYINQNTHHDEDISVEDNLSSRDRYSVDFVLANPHLYKLESACHYCSINTPSTSSKDVIIADQVNLPCENCQKNKRLSLVRKDLASDLHYIDETYYPNTPHYNSKDDSLLLDSSNTLIVEEEGWSKLTIGEVTPSTPKRLASSNSLVVDLSGRSLIKLSSSIGFLDNLTKLDLSNNQMTTLPKAIGKLRNLRILNASKNHLETIPDTMTYLSKLKAINLSHNKLFTLPKGIGQLPSLIIIILNNNQFTELPREIAHLNELMTLNVSHNPLKTIPAEITALKSLKKLLTENCPFEEEMDFPLLHDPPSLLELCARTIVKQRVHLPSQLLHPSLAEYLKKEKTCSFCHGPYFDAFVTRGRFIERMGRQIIALDYRLCCAHWSNEDDRVAALFSSPYQTPHPVVHTLNLIDDDDEDDDDDSPTLLHKQEQEDYFHVSSSKRGLRHRSSHHYYYEEPTSLASSSSASSLLLSSIPQPSSYPSHENNNSRPRSSSTSLVKANNNATRHHEPCQLIEEDTNVILPFVRHHPYDDPEQGTSQRMPKYQFPSNSLKQGFAQLGAKLKSPGRDRSDTF